MTDTRLSQIVERIETITAAQKENREILADIYAEAKGAGYDPTALREVIRQRAKGDTSALDSLVAAYMTALGGV